MVTEVHEIVFYTLETKHVMIHNRFSRSEIDPCKEIFINVEDIPENVPEMLSGLCLLSNLLYLVMHMGRIAQEMEMYNV